MKLRLRVGSTETIRWKEMPLKIKKSCIMFHHKTHDSGSACLSPRTTPWTSTTSWTSATPCPMTGRISWGRENILQKFVILSEKIIKILAKYWPWTPGWARTWPRPSRRSPGTTPSGSAASWTRSCCPTSPSSRGKTASRRGGSVPRHTGASGVNCQVRVQNPSLDINLF